MLLLDAFARWQSCISAFELRLSNPSSRSCCIRPLPACHCWCWVHRRALAAYQSHPWLARAATRAHDGWDPGRARQSRLGYEA
jgi:hypothetical protein